MGDGTIIMDVVDMEAPMAVLPQGAIPFGVVGFFVAVEDGVHDITHSKNPKTKFPQSCP